MTERNWRQICIAAVVVGGLVVVADLLLPKPKAGSAARYAIQENTMLGEIRKLRDQVSAAKAKNQPMIWALDADEISAHAMAFATKMANGRNLKVAAFRPQRPQPNGNLTMLPYQLSVEGSFPDVVRFLQAMETKGTKLAVNLVQVASADGASDHVNATIGLVAYREGESKKS
ncbi:MAG: hypothetical protein HONBIEJF_01250 [Fimbriimonadaceae bacterium]|nr:hypothetical protein [Fimbriimonadaceae bacterium]